MSATDARSVQERDAPSPSLARSMARGVTATTSVGVIIGLLLAAAGVLEAGWSIGVMAASAALAGMGLGALGHCFAEDGRRVAHEPFSPKVDDRASRVRVGRGVVQR